ncbi:MAG: hypothetical protein LBH48_06745, partial [Bifidobacteriaceae bacterium]|nr:hypothetical protein [Bifidobacteriaceae bacterium]
RHLAGYKTSWRPRGRLWKRHSSGPDDRGATSQVEAWTWLNCEIGQMGHNVLADGPHRCEEGDS